MPDEQLDPETQPNIIYKPNVAIPAPYGGDLASAYDGEVIEEVQLDAVRDMGDLFSLNKTLADKDFRPYASDAYPAKESAPDPKDLSAVESAQSSLSATVKENASSALQSQIAAAEKGSTLRRGSASSTLPS